LIGPLMPGKRPLERLAEALEHAFQPAAAERDLRARHRQLASDPRALSLYLRGLVGPGDGIGHLLVVDQFEELFTLADEAERVAFDAALAHALQDPDGPLFLVNTVRSDFLNRIELLPQLATIYNGRCQRYLLGELGKEGLREAIELSAKLAGLDVSEVTAAILRDAEGESGALPLVENALRLLWSERRGIKLNGALYENRGGLAGMLSGAADALLARIAADVPKAKRGGQAALELLLALTRYSPGGRHTRRRITREEAIQAAGNGDAALGERVLAWLAGQRDPERPSHAPGETLRLVTTGAEATPDGGEVAYVDLIHETLLRARREGGVVERGPAARANKPYWPLLSDYIETHRDRDMLRQRLAWQVERWQQGSRLASWRHLAGWGDLLDYRRLRVAKRSNPGRYVSVSWRLRGVQSTLIGAVVLVLGESLVWATANNLPLSYVFVQPLWMLGWTPIPQTVAIPPPAGGRFEMGCKPGRDDGPGLDCGSFGQALPGPRWVDLPRVCDMGKFEVTFFEYDRYVWATGGKGFSGERYPPDSGWGRGRRPVINVSWNDAQAYVAWLSQRQPGAGWRLPSEAEWEYAARANGNGPYPWGRESPKGRANYSESGVGKTLPVGSFESYGGLHDVAGNVWEWVVDKVEDERPSRVLRGGSWNDFAEGLRAADRGDDHPGDRGSVIGFRVCRWSPIEKPSAGALTAEPPKR
jgi:formylglycine-generating enzyme required for sulfatase activity